MSLLVDIKFKNLMDDIEIAKVKLGNGNLALVLRRKFTGSQTILREFRGDWQYRKFVVEACFLHAFREFTKKDKNLVTDSLSRIYNFLCEKDKVNEDKIF